MKFFGGCLVYSFHGTVPLNWVGCRITWCGSEIRCETSMNGIRYWPSSKNRRCYCNVTVIFLGMASFVRPFDSYIEPWISSVKVCFKYLKSNKHLPSFFRYTVNVVFKSPAKKLSIFNKYDLKSRLCRHFFFKMYFCDHPVSHLCVSHLYTSYDKSVKLPIRINVFSYDCVYLKRLSEFIC